MNNFEQLRQRLLNLKQSGHKEFTVGIDYLLSVLDETTTAIKEVEPTQDQQSLEVDGGQFGQTT